jgi:hypothetical protein
MGTDSNENDAKTRVGGWSTTPSNLTRRETRNGCVESIKVMIGHADALGGRSAN